MELTGSNRKEYTVEQEQGEQGGEESRQCDGNKKETDMHQGKIFKAIRNNKQMRPRESGNNGPILLD